MNLRTWLSTSFVRHFPRTPARRCGNLRLEAARGERFSFQAGLRVDLDKPEDWNSNGPQSVRAQLQAPGGWTVRIRRVGYVPVPHHNTAVPPEELDGVGHIPGFVPDPLFDEETLRLPGNETHAFWFTVTVPPDCKPGAYTLTVLLQPEKQEAIQHTVNVRVHPLTLQPRRDFRVTHWFYNDCLLEYYKCPNFNDSYWHFLPRYIDNLVSHGQDVLYVPTFTPPLDTDKRPSQLLGVHQAQPDRYEFDWADVKRYVTLARSRGITHFEWTHPFAQWGVKNAIKVYEGQGFDEQLLWAPDTGATSPTYRAFLSQFLPAFKSFLDAEGLLANSYFHLSDEPHGAEHLANYKAARTMLRELAPWMKVMDALSDITFYREGLTDLPIPSISTALSFVQENITCWCYYCCGPRGTWLNRLVDTPLAKIRMNGWLFYRWPFQGFLHWGYNYWNKSQTRIPIDPFTVQDGLGWPGWAYGDTFVVYPGPEGPIDSMRWELFAESLQDYALLQTAGVARDSELLKPLRAFNDFPKDAQWLADTRHAILTGSR